MTEFRKELYDLLNATGYKLFVSPGRCGQLFGEEYQCQDHAVPLLSVITVADIYRFITSFVEDKENQVIVIYDPLLLVPIVKSISSGSNKLDRYSFKLCACFDIITISDTQDSSKLNDNKELNTELTLENIQNIILKSHMADADMCRTCQSSGRYECRKCLAEKAAKELWKVIEP